ncbi:Uncharacterized protein MCB1EB_2287 [Mycoavidus cysteinexigens]|uniref:Uncharacterized protein n=1 Tax=Mycoavidus cysteinexigens TaxID=1553431 RepID=A0A2Z6EYH3_9BURK|nr:hypothetical protein [Mycoavidus cysteinexigens]BBE10448.1 Uncharacterized protein MCB1EB_2287 [Mycoavidus cysteinexigens]GAM53174.1 hypothetical protein EBME_1637 [bacterium endosymbiont of Mortierella elongata FMR23-6]GLR01810.1 hypothetical protein GCM10007934_16220 [Mycoavidus cysteinexigens]
MSDAFEIDVNGIPLVFEKNEWGFVGYVEQETWRQTEEWWELANEVNNGREIVAFDFRQFAVWPKVSMSIESFGDGNLNLDPRRSLREKAPPMDNITGNIEKLLDFQKYRNDIYQLSSPWLFDLMKYASEARKDGQGGTTDPQIACDALVIGWADESLCVALGWYKNSGHAEMRALQAFMVGTGVSLRELKKHICSITIQKPPCQFCGFALETLGLIGKVNSQGCYEANKLYGWEEPKDPYNLYLTQCPAFHESMEHLASVYNGFFMTNPNVELASANNNMFVDVEWYKNNIMGLKKKTSYSHMLDQGTIEKRINDLLLGHI